MLPPCTRGPQTVLSSHDPLRFFPVRTSRPRLCSPRIELTFSGIYNSDNSNSEFQDSVGFSQSCFKMAKVQNALSQHPISEPISRRAFFWFLVRRHGTLRLSTPAAAEHNCESMPGRPEVHPKDHLNA